MAGREADHGQPRSSAHRRRDVYALLDEGTTSRAGVLIHRALIGLVLVSVAVAVLESVPSLAARLGRVFALVEIVALVAFTIEYVIRLWVAVEHPPLRHLPPWRARLAYAVSPAAIVDFVSVVPVYLSFFSTSDFGVLLILRLSRFLKLARYSPGMRSLIEAIHGERRALLACVVFLGGAMLVGSALMHLAEAAAQPEAFGTIPDAMYWAIITLTTVGYGDVVPKTVFGKIVAGFTAMGGLVMLALPIGIIATAFAQVIQRRDFVVTWSMVARVPLFQSLEANDIAEIMRYLHSQSVEPDEVVVRKGEDADCMYFVAAGEVEILLPHQSVRLGEGHFFGEIAVLKRSKRSATVRASTRTKLLVLDAADLRSVMERRPGIAETIGRIADERLAAHRVGPRGDLAAEELDAADAGAPAPAREGPPEP